MIRVDHEWTAANRTYGRFIRNFRREERFNFAGETQGVEITRGATDRFNFNYAVGHTAVLSPSHGARHEGELAALQRRPVPALHHRSGEPRVCGVDGGAVRRLPADAELRPRVDVGHCNRPRREARRAAERVQQRPHAAVLQRPDRADDHEDGRHPYLENRIRLAAAAPGRDEPRVESRRLRVRRHLHAIDKRRHESVRPGHCVLHARHSAERLVRRDAQQLRRARPQPRRVRARRLARVGSAHVEPRHPLRSRAGTQ